MDYKKRLTKLQASLKRKKLDALLISQPENRRYLTGYRGGDNSIGETSGVLLVPAKGAAHLLTDSRFELQAKEESPQTEIHLYRKSLIASIVELFKDLGGKSLGFESSYTLHSTFLKLQEAFTKEKLELVATEGIVEKMRIIKDEDEIDILRKSVLLNEQVFELIYNDIDQYQTEIDITLALETAMRKMGAEGPSFHTIVASGARGAMPHATPGNYPLQQGKSLTIDMGLILGGYCSDMTRTFALGEPEKKYSKIHRIVRKAQLAGIKAVKAGVTGASVDKIARDVIDEAGYGEYFGHGLGHGVGLAIHEEPRLSRLNTKKLEAGMVVTVEPGIYIPGWGGIRLEDMVVVRENGCERLNTNNTWLDI